MLGAAPPAGSTVDLARRLQHFLHRVEIEPPRRQIGIDGVAGLQRAEAVGVAARLVERLLAIDLRFLRKPVGLGAGARQNVVAIGLCLVAQPLLIGAGALHVVERVDNGLGRIDALQLHLRDLTRRNRRNRACCCSSVARVVGDLLALVGKAGLDRVEADDPPHRALPQQLHRAFGIIDVEEEFRRVLHAP